MSDPRGEYCCAACGAVYGTNEFHLCEKRLVEIARDRPPTGRIVLNHGLPEYFNGEEWVGMVTPNTLEELARAVLLVMERWPQVAETMYGKDLLEKAHKALEKVG